MLLQHSLIFYLGLLLWTRPTLGCLQLNGQDINFPATTPNVRFRNGFDSQDHGVSPSLQFTCSGRIDAWEAYFERRGTYSNIKFQVWRPVQDPTSGCTTPQYDLVGTNSFSNHVVDNTLFSRFVPVPESVIEFQMGDIVGFHAVKTSSRQTSFQYNLETPPNSPTYYDDRQSSLDVDGISTLNSCNLRQYSFVPLLTVVVTEDVITTMISSTSTQLATTSSVSLSTTTSTTLMATIPESTTAQPGTSTELPATNTEPLSTTMASTQQTSTQNIDTELTATTTESIIQTTGTSESIETTTELPPSTMANTQPTSVSDTQPTTVSDTQPTSISDTQSTSVSDTQPTLISVPDTETEIITTDVQVVRTTDNLSGAGRNEQTIPLTTLILAVVVAFVVSVIVVITAIILFKCVCRRRKRRNLDLSVPTGTYGQQSNNHIYSEMNVTNPVALSGVDSKACEAYEVPLSKTPPPPYSVGSKRSRDPPASLKQGLENTYEVPVDSKKVQALKKDNLYSNTSFGSRKLSSTDYSLPPLPMESEYTFMNPRNTPANLRGIDEDYCDIDALEGKLNLGVQQQSQEGQNGLSESNIYESLPF